jgi:hypothetical protein
VKHAARPRTLRRPGGRAPERRFACWFPRRRRAMQRRSVCRFYALPEAGLDSHFFPQFKDECDKVAQYWPDKWILETPAAFATPSFFGRAGCGEHDVQRRRRAAVPAVRQPGRCQPPVYDVACDARRNDGAGRDIGRTVGFPSRRAGRCQAVRDVRLEIDAASFHRIARCRARSRTRGRRRPARLRILTPAPQVLRPTRPPEAM